MPEIINANHILDELKAIRNDLDFIKAHMVGIDSIITEDDYLVLKKYRKEKSANEFVSHEDLKKELGL